MSTPVIAIVGRPNVGKSTLFNILTNSRDALVHDRPGVTRDRIFGEGRWDIDKSSYYNYTIIDTGGINGDEQGIDACMADQALKAIHESDVIFWLVDARAGLTPIDEQIANQLRVTGKPVIVIANKIDSMDPDTALAEFYTLGIGQIFPIAAAHRRGIASLLEEVLPKYCSDFDSELDLADLETARNNTIKVAIIGRPNVGKSTLINRMLGEERVVVYDQPGTTTDSIYIPLERDGREYILIDTAGIRRRGRITDVIEKFSIVKTLQAIKEADVVIALIDSSENLTEQDLHLLKYTQDSGKSLIIACNKWDGLSEEQKEKVTSDLERRLDFVSYAKKFFISAKHGTNVGNLWKNIIACYDSAILNITTSKLTNLLEQAVNTHQPPLVNGRRIKLRYAHLGSNHPFLIVIHGKQTDSIPDHYKRFLIKFFQEKLKIVGTPILLSFKTDDNPYEGIRNTLTPRQMHKRQRMIKHRKSREK
ncbi:MAG: ribosome biogenesis GTPase Der [Gammaproteobacteria bacterium]|nr:ribosome biogenesis GTPase Der [Gammaproteobacteria bacterium]